MTLDAILTTTAGAEVDRAQAKVGPDTIAKLLFTSGSTGTPKGVINTHRMMTSNQAMLRGVNPSYAAEPPVLIDWLPWSHTFGGNNNFNLVLANGGSFFIDEGRPLPGAIEATVRNLSEISPTVYYNVPRGFEMLLPYLQADRELRRSLFARLQAFCYAGAALAPHVREGYERLGLETVGEIVPMVTSFGSTETGPSAISVTERARDPGVVGVPNPGVEVKLVPNAGKLEARVKSPSVTPGYWREPRLTEAAFDEEGFYKFGDALRFADERRSRTRLPVRWTRGGGFQARHRHLGQRRSVAGEIRRPLRALCDRRRCRRTRPRRRRCARHPEPRRLPRARRSAKPCGGPRGDPFRARACGRRSPACSRPSTLRRAAAPAASPA